MSLYSQEEICEGCSKDVRHFCWYGSCPHKNIIKAIKEIAERKAEEEALRLIDNIFRYFKYKHRKYSEEDLIERCEQWLKSHRGKE
jgi:hypothetical protein